MSVDCPTLIVGPVTCDLSLPLVVSFLGYVNRFNASALLYKQIIILNQFPVKWVTLIIETLFPSGSVLCIPTNYLYCIR